MARICGFFLLLLFSTFGHDIADSKLVPYSDLHTIRPLSFPRARAAFFNRATPKKVDSTALVPKPEEDRKCRFLPQLSNLDLTKVAVVAATGVVVTTVCYRYVQKWIRYHLYDQYIRPNAPGIAESLGHVLYKAKNPNALQMPKTWLENVSNTVVNMLNKVGFLRALLASSVCRVPIGDAIDEGTVTAIYFHSGSLNKLLKDQGYLDFGPSLEKIYESMKSSGKKFQVVYVSLDGSSLAALDDFSKMPWYAVPFGDRERIVNLCKLYGIVTVPSVVLVDSNGTVINDRALYVMETKPNDYPWKVENNLDLIPDMLLNSVNDQVSKATLQGKLVGLYFGAGWTKSSKDFNQKLQEYSRALKRKTGDKFEIVYVSNDKDQQQFECQIQENDDSWFAIPFDDVKSRMLLLHYFKVQTLPSLVLLDPNGNVISRDGRFYAETDTDADALEYKSYLHNTSPAKVEDIADNIDGFAHFPVVIAFADNATPKAQEEIESQINDAALVHSNNRKGRELKFFVTKKPHKRVDMVKSICSVPKGSEKDLIILDLFSNAVYYDPLIKTINKETILQLVDDFYRGKLKRRSLNVSP